MPDTDYPIVHTAECAAQHFAPWMIDEHWFRSAVEAVKNGTLQPVQATDGEGAAERAPYTVHNGTAIISVAGAIMKKASKYGGTSSVATRSAIRKAINDDDVNSILLHIDSPGGTVAGTADLAADVKAADGVKPVHAHIEDLGASAAYWVASQARRVTANATALVGSIGTLLVLQDSSGSYAAKGIKVHVVSTGKYKGAGAEGAPITDEQLAAFQEEVDDLNAHFLDGVAKGRGMSIGKVRAAADGRVHIAEKAKAMGLIDGVASLSEAFAALQSEARGGAYATQQQPTPAQTPAPNKSTTPSPAAPLSSSVHEEAHNERTSLMANDPTQAAPAQNSAAGTDPVISQSNTPSPAPVTVALTQDQQLAHLRAMTSAGYVEQGRKVGIDAGRTQERERLEAIVAACPGKPQLALDTFLRGQDAVVAKLTFEAENRADNRAKEIEKTKDLEIQRLNALLAVGGSSGVAMSLAGIEDTGPTMEPKAQAEYEWENKPEVRKTARTKDIYVMARTAELDGTHRTFQPAGA